MRVQDWPVQLHQTIAKHDKLFNWGTSDCMQLCMDVAEAITGTHPYPDTKGKYKTRSGAMKVLKSKGFENIIEALAAKYKVIPSSLAQRGDIGIVSMPDGTISSCVCEGVNFVGKGPESEGLVRFPRSFVVQAFRVE